MPAFINNVWEKLLFLRHKAKIDVLIFFLIAIGSSAFLLALSYNFNSFIFGIYADNTWFQADVARTSANMALASSDHYRTKIHPIASLVSLPFTNLIAWFWPGTYYEHATRFIAFIGGLWAAGIYVLGLTLGAKRPESVAFALLGISSASFIFWFSVPETYGLGAIGFLVVLIVAAISETTLPRNRYFIFASASSLSITVTNWMAGISLSFTRLPWRTALKITLQALAIVAFLAIIQKLLLPSSRLFFIPNAEEATFLNRPESGTVWHKLQAIFMHSYVAPEPGIKESPAPFWPILSMQFSRPGSGSSVGMGALALWIGLVGFGIWGAIKSQKRIFVIVLGMITLGQVILHMIYGEETFLYSLHFASLLIACCIFSIFTPLRRWILPIIFLSVILGLTNNLLVFNNATHRVDGFLNQRELTLDVIKNNPKAIWPKGIGHVVLGGPLDALDQKAYHEPGASLSPAPGSFGVSIWITDLNGRFIASSESIPLTHINQRFAWSSQQSLPAIKTDTQHYEAEWSRESHVSILKVKAKSHSNNSRLWVVIRSVGPAGGPLKTAEYHGKRLIINGKWIVESSSAFNRLVVNDEQLNSINLQSLQKNLHSSKSGWLYIATEMQPDVENKISFKKLTQSQSPDVVEFLPSPWKPSVPDEHFSKSAIAQQAHLLMGITNGETRPGDPMNYTFPWIRDAAFILVALARTGQVGMVRKLLPELANQDFYGGFGAEADGPGLSIWALSEASQVLNDPDLDKWIWPQIERKVEWIKVCLNAKNAVMANAQMQLPYSPWSLVRKDFRVCEPARNGLIVGRMDNHFPIMSINATAHIGLLSAALMAERLGKAANVLESRKRSYELQLAWQEELMKPRIAKAADALLEGKEGIKEIVASPSLGTLKRLISIARDWSGNNHNERLTSIAQWPGWIVGNNDLIRKKYLSLLESRWAATHDTEQNYSNRPLWTYFEIGQAHQWLYMGRPERSWQILRWFYANQSSPGLYTWWEGEREENTMHRWPTTRGWVNPKTVTPHYWTAAEVLLLQMDMLVYVDESKENSPIIIGAGVLEEWLSKPIDSGLIHTSRGPVRWKWRDNHLNIQLTKSGLSVELGPVFKGKPYSITY